MLGIAGPASACTCAPPLSIAEELAESDAVFSGIIHQRGVQEGHCQRL
jgi:hypothetical protein